MSDSHSPPQLNRPVSSASRIRLLVLLGLLVLMLGALWYDYKVARPAVESAYARITQLNGKINSQGGNRYMTNQDVQKELNRAPFETFSEVGYFVEVYGWRGGLPTKRHKYYAVYTDKFIFLKHYMNILDIDELRKQPLVEIPGTRAESTDSVTAQDLSDAPVSTGGQKQGGQKAATGAESADPGDSVKETAAPSDSNAKQAKESAADSSDSKPTQEKPAADDAQPKG